MSELSEQLTSTVTRRETEHSISKSPCHHRSAPSPAIADARRRRRPARDPAPGPAARAPRAPRAHPPPGSGGRGAGARRCKRATARTVTEHGARRGRAARDRSSDRPTATWHGRRAMGRSRRGPRALGTFPCTLQPRGPDNQNAEITCRVNRCDTVRLQNNIRIGSPSLRGSEVQQRPLSSYKVPSTQSTVNINVRSPHPTAKLPRRGRGAGSHVIPSGG